MTRFLSGYQILTQIYESPNSIVYRGIRQQDNQSIILKMVAQDYPTPAEITRYKQEYEIVSNLKIEGVVKAYSLLEYQRRLAIVLEDFGGTSLKMLINPHSADVIHVTGIFEKSQPSNFFSLTFLTLVSTFCEN